MGNNTVDNWLQRTFPVLRRLFFLGIIGYGILFCLLSLRTPVDRFLNPDSMNYVDVARNIAAGRGIVQSAIGFNDPHFSPEWSIPRPMTSQPPLYPLMIAALGVAGFGFENAALLIAEAGLGGILLFGYGLVRELYGEGAALLGVVLMGLFWPLYFTAGFPLSDTLGMSLVLAALYLLVRERKKPFPSPAVLLLAGCLAGLAFAARYAMLPAIPLGCIVLWERRGFRVTIRRLGFFLLGCSLPVGLVLGRNLLLSGALMGVPRNPSTIGLWGNLAAAYELLCGGYLGETATSPGVHFWANFAQWGAAVQIWMFWGGWGILTLVLLVQKKWREAVFEQRRFLLPLWTLMYLAFLIYQRTLTHFDWLDDRLIFPAGITLALMLAGFLTTGLHLKAHILIFPALIWLGIANGHLIGETLNIPAEKTDLASAVYRSPRLRWLEEHTTDRDLIIGGDVLDVPFFLRRSGAVSFSPYPYTDFADYAKLSAFVHLHCAEYDHFYLVLRTITPGDMAFLARGKPFDLRQFYGPFIADLYEGRLEAYPEVSLVEQMADGIVFEWQCRNPASAVGRNGR